MREPLSIPEETSIEKNIGKPKNPYKFESI